MGRKTQENEDALTIDRPETFLRHERAAQRAGIVLLTLFVGAGLAGMFGTGPLADAAITSGNATIRYERFGRQTFSTQVAVSVTNVTTPTVTIQVSRQFIDRVDMLEVRPPDALKQLGDDFAVFEVPATGGTATLVLQFEPRHFGVLEGDVAAAGQSPVRLRQIIFF